MSEKKIDPLVEVYRRSESKSGIIKRIGDLRDGLLVLTTCVYIAGYLSWTSYAFENNLGPIPALDAQFLSAGLVPVMVIVTFYYSTRILFYVRHWLKKSITDRQRKIGYILLGTAAVLVLSSAVVDWVAPDKYANSEASLTIAALVGVYAGLCFSRGRFEKLIMQPFALFLAWSYVILGGFWLLHGYYVVWFPTMPQELGGPRAKCVQLDLATSHLSAETRAQLIGSSDVTGVHRSRALDLIFMGSEFAILETKSSWPESGKIIFRVKNSAIETIFPCQPSS